MSTQQWRLRQKLNGGCTRCLQPAREDANLCERHTALKAAWDAKRVRPSSKRSPTCACPSDIQSRHLLECPAMVRLDPERREKLAAICEQHGYSSVTACVGWLIDAQHDAIQRIARINKKAPKKRAAPLSSKGKEGRDK